MRHEALEAREHVGHEAHEVREHVRHKTRETQEHVGHETHEARGHVRQEAHKAREHVGHEARRVSNLAGSNFIFNFKNIWKRELAFYQTLTAFFRTGKRVSSRVLVETSYNDGFYMLYIRKFMRS